MNDTLEAYAVLLGIPALIGLALPGRTRRIVGLAAAAIALLLWARGLNVHGASVLFFFLGAGIAAGALLREVGAALWRGTMRRSWGHG